MTYDMTAPSSDPAERWAALAMRARHSRLSRELFEVDVPLPRVGRFELEGLRGMGAMGAVFAARDPQLERRVAVKLLMVPDSVAPAARLLAEAKALARLSHPNVVTLYEVGVHGDELFVVMELLDAGPLSRLWQGGTPSIRALLDAFVQAGEGLAAAHEARIVHCDFKPSNVLVTTDGRVKVADFGLARLVEAAVSQAASPSTTVGTASSTTTLRGTPAYMAPELLLGARPSERSDIYGFCVSLWEALHGCRPFPGGDASAGSLAPRRARPVPRWLDRALVRGLASDPSARWPTMRALLKVLRETPRRRRAERWAAAAVPVVLVAGVVGQYLSRGPTCAERAEDLDAVWGAAQREALEAAWRTGASFERESLPVVRDRLDGWAAAWVDVQRQACVATYEERRRSEVAFDRTMACLDRRRAALGSTTELLASARPEVVASAGVVLDALAHPSSCLEAPASERAAVPSPPGPEIAALEQGIDRARLLVAAGDPAAALAELDASAAQAAERPLLAAEHQLVRGRALLVAGQWGPAGDALAQAAPSALHERDDALAAEAFVALAELELDRQRYDEASRWLELADAEQRRAEVGPRERARVRDVGGSIALRRGDPEGAEERHREALALLEGATQSDALAFTIRRHIGVALATRGRYAAAEAVFAALASDVEAEHGPRHPDLGTIAMDLAVDARERGDLRVALAHAERGHRLLVDAFGAGSMRVAPTLLLVADLRSELGEPQAAIPLAEQAWRLQRDHLPAGHSERGTALALLAWLRLRTGDYEAALASNLELEHEYQQGPHRAELPAVSHDVGICLCALGRCREAYDRFFALHRELRDDEPLAPYAASGLALAQLSRGRCDQAEALAERTLERVLAAPTDDADLRAELRLVAATCRLAAGDRAAAAALAREAAADQPSAEVRRLFGEDVLALLDGGRAAPVSSESSPASWRR